MMVNNISNQTVHHQSTTKFASMLQDVKKLPACKTSKYLLHFWYCTKKSIINIFNHVFTDWVIISLLNTYVEKILKLGNRMWRQTSDWVTCAKPSKRNTDSDVSHTFSWRFLNKTTQNALAMLYREFLRKKKHNYQIFCLNLWFPRNWVSCDESWKSLLPVFVIFQRTDFGGFLVCC